MRALAAFLALALLAGCSRRERANPFDPGNPVTRGRPAGFAAIAGAGLVQLRWTPPPLSGTFGYRVFRLVEGDNVFRPVGPLLTGNESSYFDLPVTNGLRLDYRLYFVFSNVLGGLPAEDHATPGLLRPWVADLSRRSLIEATPDGRHVAFETAGFFGPTHVAVEPGTGRVWISDTYDGRVVLFDPANGTRVPITGLSEPVAIAIDPVDRSAWVCDQALDAVYHYTSTGAPGVPDKLDPIDTPIGIAVDPAGTTVWVCERGGNRVRRFSRAGVPLGATDVPAPSRVAVDSANGDAWVTSSDGHQVVHLSPAGAALDTVTDVSSPVGIAVDARNGRIWVADPVAGQVLALRRGGAIEFRVGGLPGAREIAIDPASGEAWVTVSGSGELVRLSATGVALERLGGLSDPYGVALDTGQRGP